MRILAVRGCNLTSFAGEFELDFEAEPIRSAGIFAIVGPTGAGKTTVLDAICLALYDRLPRLDGADGSAEVGRADAGEAGRVGYNDVRGILRHGAGSGFAEVDFVGQDGLKYRSRWSVNRARGRADGKLQWQKLTLTCLSTGNVIGDKKKETLDEIEARIGLSFEQFRRAVMLAQGDFDTFIKAKPKDRAELLERITGTQIYSELSMAAFARAKASREAVAVFEDRLKLFPCMEPEVREAAERKLAEAQVAVAATEAQQRSLEATATWHREKLRLEASVTATVDALQQTRAADVAAEGEREAFKQARRAFELRPEYEASASAASALQAALAEVEAAATALEDARRTSQAAGETAREAKNRLARERERHAGTLADVVRAEALDERLAAAQADLHHAEVAATAANETYAAASEARANAERQFGKVRERIEANQEWLASREHLGQLAGCLDRVMKDLGQYSAAVSRSGEFATAADQFQSKLKTISAQRAAAVETAATARKRENELGAIVADLQREAATIDVPATEQRLQHLATVTELCSEGTRLAQQIASAKIELETAAAERERLTSARNGDLLVVEEADHELPSLAARLDEARRSAALSGAAADEATHRLRALLVDGEPCPVCGAVEHPVSAVDELLLRRLREDQSRVAELADRLDELKESRTAAAARAQAATASLAGLSERIDRAEAQAANLAAAWDRCRRSLADGGLVLGIDTQVPEACGNARAALARMSGTAAEQRPPLETALNAARRAGREALEKSRELTAVRRELDEVQAQADQLARAEGDLRRSAEIDAAKQDELRRSLADLEARLDGDLADVLADWRTQPEASDRCRVLVGEWRERQGRAKDLLTERADLETEIAKLRSGEGMTKSAADTAITRLAEKRAAVTRLVSDRSTLLGGRAAADVRSEADAGLAATIDTADKAVATATGAAQRLAAAEARRAAGEAAHARAAVAAEQKRQLFEAALTAAQLDAPAVVAALSAGSEALAQTSERLDALRTAVRDEETRLAERTAALAAHEARRPEAEPDDVEAALVEVAERLHAAREQLEDARMAIAADDQAREKGAAIAAARDAELEKSKVWRQLDELIGSADGAKFRRFAQSLTLTQLVRLANRHLDELCPRYELQRAPGSDLALQVVDHDMAGEVRGLHNLSGGERFLMSLALALGLAGMSSGRGVKVESLFIDEGFGSLDGASLATAVAVLEQLHATGRRVGVISHVEELKERIAVKVEVSQATSGSSALLVYSA